MPQACIRLELPRERWKTGVSQKHSDLSFRIRDVATSGDHAVETVVVSGDVTEECLSDLESHPDIETFEVIEQHRYGVTVYLQTLEPVLLSSVAEAGTPLVCPAELQCGELRATVVGTHAAISSLGDQLQSAGLTFELTSIQSNRDASDVLTPRQEEVFVTAVECGYYQSPRQCTLTDVADSLGIAKSTCSGILQRAEAAVVEYFCIQQQLPEPDSVTTQRAPVGERSSG